jgi:hypothetical protein
MAPEHTGQPPHEPNQYLITNDFGPTVSRSVLDKNRQNIKKINNIYSKLKTRIKPLSHFADEPESAFNESIE